MKNHTIELINNHYNKRSKIVEINKTRVIAKRTFLFTTTMENNSVGAEILYDNLFAAITGEEEWMKPERSKESFQY